MAFGSFEVQTKNPSAMLSDHKIIAIYCLVDDVLKAVGHREDSRVRVFDSEIITTAFVSMLYFGGHLDHARCFMKSYGYVPLMVDKSRFCRRLHRLSDRLLYVFHYLGQYLKDYCGAEDYQMDAFPVAACHNVRIRRCKLFRQEAFRGRHSAMGQFFFGVRVHVLTLRGVPVEFCLVPGRQNDTNALYKLPLQVPPESAIYLDAGYTDYRAEDVCLQAEGVLLKTERKSNSTRKDTPSAAFLKNRMCKKVETTISLIKARMLRSIHAVTQHGFLLKVALFVIAFTFDKIANHHN